jgi:hypothetical protein
MPIFLPVMSPLVSFHVDFVKGSPYCMTGCALGGVRDHSPSTRHMPHHRCWKAHCRNTSARHLLPQVRRSFLLS